MLEKKKSSNASTSMLFTPFRMGKLELKNRIVMTPFQLGYGNIDGSVSELMVDHYRQMAASGVALVMVEYCAVDQAGVGLPSTLRVDGEKYLPGLSRLVEVIHGEGALAFLQLSHTGRYAFVDEGFFDRIFRPCTRLSASPVRTWGVVPKEMTTEEIKRVVDAFAEGGALGKRAGFDAVEIHGAAGYLISQFLSPKVNKRKDEYGGSFENRMRFALEILDAVLSAVGSDYPLGYRFMADEGIPNGLHADESLTLATELERRGITYLSVMGGGYDAFTTKEWQRRERQEGYMVDYAALVRKAVAETPILACGRIQSPALANKILEEGTADLIGLARVLFADSDWPRKAAGTVDEPIVECDPYCDDCTARLKKIKPAFCTKWPVDRQIAFLTRIGERKRG